jgi:hypothetical protein
MTQQRRDQFRAAFGAFEKARLEVQESLGRHDYGQALAVAVKLEELLRTRLRQTEFKGRRYEAPETSTEKFQARCRAADFRRACEDALEENDGEDQDLVVIRLNVVFQKLEEAAEYAFRRHGLVPADLL